MRNSISEPPSLQAWVPGVLFPPLRLIKSVSVELLGCKEQHSNNHQEKKAKEWLKSGACKTLRSKVDPGTGCSQFVFSAAWSFSYAFATYIECLAPLQTNLFCLLMVSVSSCLWLTRGFGWPWTLQSHLGLKVTLEASLFRPAFAAVSPIWVSQFQIPAHPFMEVQVTDLRLPKDETPLNQLSLVSQLWLVGNDPSVGTGAGGFLPGQS